MTTTARANITLDALSSKIKDRLAESLAIPYSGTGPLSIPDRLMPEVVFDDGLNSLFGIAKYLEALKNLHGSNAECNYDAVSTQWAQGVEPGKASLL